MALAGMYCTYMDITRRYGRVVKEVILVGRERDHSLLSDQAEFGEDRLLSPYQLKLILFSRKMC